VPKRRERKPKPKVEASPPVDIETNILADVEPDQAEVGAPFLRTLYERGALTPQRGNSFAPNVFFQNFDEVLTWIIGKCLNCK
jgi:hypothetical protein